MLAEPGWDRGSTAGTWPPYPRAVVRQRRRRSDRPLFGILLLAVGVVWLLNVTIVNLTSETILSVLLMLLGAGMVFTGRRGGKGWPLLLGLILTVALIGSSTSLNLNAPTSGGFGNRSYAPTTAGNVQTRYALAAGNLNLDLSGIPTGDPVTKIIKVTDGFGNIVITVPRDAAVDVQASIAAGNFTVFDLQPGHGVGVHEHYRSPNFTGALQKFTFVVRDLAGNITVAYPYVASPKPFFPLQANVPGEPSAPTPPSVQSAP